MPSPKHLGLIAFAFWILFLTALALPLVTKADPGHGNTLMTLSVGQTHTNATSTTLIPMGVLTLRITTYGDPNDPPEPDPATAIVAAQQLMGLLGVAVLLLMKSRPWRRLNIGPTFRQLYDPPPLISAA